MINSLMSFHQYLSSSYINMCINLQLMNAAGNNDAFCPRRCCLCNQNLINEIKYFYKVLQVRTSDSYNIAPNQKYRIHVRRFFGGVFWKETGQGQSKVAFVGLLELVIIVTVCSTCVYVFKIVPKVQNRALIRVGYTD